MKSEEIRNRFLKFFEKREHVIIPSASLLPENDPTALFTTAGMHPLAPHFLGESHPAGKRLVNVQKCLRTVDIDEVGDNRHLTFFEMLGNWSLGDYYKKEIIAWSYELLTDKESGFGFDPARLYITVFAGDAQIPRDEEAVAFWKAAGIPEGRIYYLKDNFWGPTGETGPCGPDTEMFYDVAGTHGDLSHDEFVAADEAGDIVEIWNDVFLEYFKEADGSFRPLKQKNIDTGAGLERLAVMLQNKTNVYETDLFVPIIDRIVSLGNVRDEHAEHVIADHVRAAVFLLADSGGVVPSNVDQGYILRRLIRRAVRLGPALGVTVDQDLCVPVAETIIDHYGDFYPELLERKDHVLSELQKEETRFEETLEHGLKEFEKLAGASISGTDAFKLFSTYGFPLEMTQELARERGIAVDEAAFHAEMEKHQEVSRAGAQQKFAGGLADHSKESTQLHTATHLLHQALRNVLGDHVYQKGSNITSERLRFDFSHPEKMTKEQIAAVEDLVNKKIQEDLPVSYEEMDIAEAQKRGAIGLFEEKYGNRVRVYKMGDFSYEICGGPHVEHTGQLSHFKIVKEEPCSAGIRRIKAVLVDSEQSD